MARRKRNQKKADETLVDIVEVRDSAQSFVDNNQQLIFGALVALVLAIGGVFAYNNFYMKPRQVEAEEQMFRAQEQFEQDSFALALTNPGGGYMGFLDIVDSYWHGVIVPVVNVEDNDIIRLWRHGAYMHFRADGIAGYNWSEPKNYDYNKVNVWRQDGNTFTLTMSGAVYTFELRDDQAPLVAYLQPGGAFKMTMKRQ